MLMNFMHAAAIIKAGSGVKDFLAGTFGSIDKMLDGIKYPQHFRALRMLVEKLFRDVVQEPEVISFTRLIEVLEVRHHVKTVITMMNFSRGGHEGDWTLHLFAADVMLPAGCHNYGRYGAFYVHQMKGLNPEMMMKL